MPPIPTGVSDSDRALIQTPAARRRLVALQALLPLILPQIDQARSTHAIPQFVLEAVSELLVRLDLWKHLDQDTASHG